VFNEIKTYRPMKSFISFFIALSINAYAQFPGPVGSINTTAMHKDSSAFKGWAATCIVNRGWQDIADESLGLADVGVNSNATGKAGEHPVVSLGDGGEAILTFQPAIKNGPGFDFAVFENAFNDNFLELAFVEVSSNGIDYVRFPAHSHTAYSVQIGPFDEMGDASKLHHLAGKYRGGYGTPFDLEELEGSPNLNTQAITHVKIIDVVGCISIPYARYDLNNNPINDPYPTAFGSGGFDLDAVGVIHQAPIGVNENTTLLATTLYPNPCANFVYLNGKQTSNLQIEIINQQGSSLATILNVNLPYQLVTDHLQDGIYTVKISNDNNAAFKKLVIARGH
jgi:hypothetical protein